MIFGGASKASLYCILRNCWKKLENRLGDSLKTPEKTLGPAPALQSSNFDRKGKFAVVSRRSAGPPLARGPFRRNRSNRLKTGPACVYDMDHESTINYYCY